LAAQSRTPLQYILGELTNINSETLIASETGLVQKVEEFELHASTSMRRVFQLIAKALGNDELAQEIRTAEILWKDPQTRTMAQAADAAIKDRAVGMPFAWVAANRYGLDPEQIEKIVAIREDEAAQLLQGDLAIAFGQKPAEPVEVTPADASDISGS
jgi:anion-transporting  ArsA/GET3 family ATPase